MTSRRKSNAPPSVSTSRLWLVTHSRMWITELAGWGRTSTPNWTRRLTGNGIQTYCLFIRGPEVRKRFNTFWSKCANRGPIKNLTLLMRRLQTPRIMPRLRNKLCAYQHDARRVWLQCLRNRLLASSRWTLLNRFGDRFRQRNEHWNSFARRVRFERSSSFACER